MLTGRKRMVDSSNAGYYRLKQADLGGQVPPE